MTKDEAHNLECARAAILSLVERAKSRKEADGLKRWLRDIETEAFK